MLEESASLRHSLDQAREVYDSEGQRSFDDYNLEVARVIDTEWIMMTHDVPMHRLEGEQDAIQNSPWFYSSWATVERSYDEESQNGAFLQAQLRKKLGGMVVNKLEVYTRLVDTKGWRDVFSEPERIIMITAGRIALKDYESERGYRYITPENEEDWQNMLSTLEQLKQADFSDMLLIPSRVTAKDSAAA